jgi:hypothetical protein
MQAARVLFPVPERPTVGVDKFAFFCNPASRGTFSITAIKNKNRKQIAIAKANEFPHIEAWVRVGRGILHVKGYYMYSTQGLPYSKK